MRQTLGLVACLAILAAAACETSTTPRLRLSREPVTEDGLHLVQHRGAGRMVVSPDLDRVRAKIRSSPNIVVTGCGLTLKDQSIAAELQAVTASLSQGFCDAFKDQLTNTLPLAQELGIQAIRSEGLTLVDRPGQDTLAMQIFLLGVEIDRASQGLLVGSRPTVGVLFSDSLSSEPLMRYYVQERVSGGVDDLVAHSFREAYELYTRIVLSGGTDVAAPSE